MKKYFIAFSHPQDREGLSKNTRLKYYLASWYLCACKTLHKVLASSLLARYAACDFNSAAWMHSKFHHFCCSGLTQSRRSISLNAELHKSSQTATCRCLASNPKVKCFKLCHSLNKVGLGFLGLVRKVYVPLTATQPLWRAMNTVKQYMAKYDFWTTYCFRKHLVYDVPLVIQETMPKIMKRWLEGNPWPYSCETLYRRAPAFSVATFYLRH